MHKISGFAVPARTRRVGDVLIVDMVGRLIAHTLGPASTELNQIAQEGHGKLVLNAHGLEYVSSAGLRAILVAARLVQVHGGALKICDANTAVKQVMGDSGVSRLLKLYDTEKEALAAFVDEPQRARGRPDSAKALNRYAIVAGHNRNTSGAAGFGHWAARVTLSLSIPGVPSPVRPNVCADQSASRTHHPGA